MRGVQERVDDDPVGLASEAELGNFLPSVLLRIESGLFEPAMRSLLHWVRMRFASAKPTEPSLPTPPAEIPLVPVDPPSVVIDLEPRRSMARSAVSSERRAVSMGEANVEHVAEWMAATLERHGFLYQEVAVKEVAELFGARFTYVNAAGNRAINKDVLAAFNRLTGKSVAWEVGPRAWRRRPDKEVDKGAAA